MSSALLSQGHCNSYNKVALEKNAENNSVNALHHIQIFSWPSFQVSEETTC